MHARDEHASCTKSQTWASRSDSRSSFSTIRRAICSSLSVSGPFSTMMASPSNSPLRAVMVSLALASYCCKPMRDTAPAARSPTGKGCNWQFGLCQIQHGVSASKTLNRHCWEEFQFSASHADACCSHGHLSRNLQDATETSCSAANLLTAGI